MISWIQRTFQTHFKWIFLVLLAVTIISFIVTIGNTPGLGQAGPKTIQRTFFGYDIDQQATAAQVFGDANLSAQLQTGFARLSNDQLQNYAYERLAAIALADQLKLPQPTKEQVSDYIKRLRAFAGSDGKFDPSRYASFRDNLKTSPGASEGDIARVLSDDVRIEHLRKLLAGPGYVLSNEVKDQLIQTDSKWTIAVATLDYADFKPDIAVPPDALQRYFNENAFRYVVPPRVGVDYVLFPASAYLSKVKATPAQVRAYYDDHQDEFPAPAKEKAGAGKKSIDLPVGKAADADFAAVRPKVEQAYKEERARHLAAEDAANLTVDIYNQKLKPGTADFASFVAARKLTVKQVPPFDQATAPQDLGWPSDVIDQALKLSADKPVSDALPVKAGSVVLFWRNTLPSYQPKLEQVRARVTADYKENERRKEFVALGNTLHARLAAALKNGATLAAAAAALPVKPDEPKLAVKDYPAFTPRQPPAELNASVLSALGHMRQGELSSMLIAQAKGYFVYAKDRQLPVMNPNSTTFTEARQQMAALTAAVDQNLYLREIVNRELKKTQPSSS